MWITTIILLLVGVVLLAVDMRKKDRKISVLTIVCFVAGISIAGCLCANRLQEPLIHAIRKEIIF